MLFTFKRKELEIDALIIINLHTNRRFMWKIGT